MAKKVTIYSTVTCPYCKMEKEYLDSKGIKYENIFVDQDPKAAEEMVKISNQMGVPFTVITKEDGSQETILGFDKQKLVNALGIVE
ncbi:NrdH-redoxin [Candidatus Daviesbacteria bacterium]|nr:NrdH-redoxin [Candidatus Daviesbacteria bacterium]